LQIGAEVLKLLGGAKTGKGKTGDYRIFGLFLIGRTKGGMMGFKIRKIAQAIGSASIS